MKRLGMGIFAAIGAAGFGLTTVNAQTQTQTAPTPPADFGAPPSGEIPILFNDRHVYSKPDRLKQNRVLAALVRGNTILVPLRSTFEQTGATVSYDPASKTVDVSKPGSDVKVTVGRPEVVINGESRPLDVPPEIYRGTVVVPLRVISEGMGAYVQWVTERKTVVIRYVAPASPPPPPGTTPAPMPTDATTPTPTASPVSRRRIRYDHFIVGDYLFAPKIYNEFAPGNKGTGVSYSARAALEFALFRLPLMIAGEYRSFRYPHADNGTRVLGDPGFVTVIGGYGQTEIPSFIAKDSDFDGRLGIKVFNPRVYIAASYLHREENYGYPKQNGVGFGIEKLPDLDRTLSIYGDAYYFPSVDANFRYPTDLYTCPPGGTAACAGGSLAGTSAKFSDRILRYRVGFTLALTRARNALGVFLDGGYLGDSIHGKTLSPGNARHTGAYAGLGLKL